MPARGCAQGRGRAQCARRRRSAAQQRCLHASGDVRRRAVRRRAAAAAPHARGRGARSCARLLTSSSAVSAPTAAGLRCRYSAASRSPRQRRHPCRPPRPLTMSATQMSIPTRASAAAPQLRRGSTSFAAPRRAAAARAPLRVSAAVKVGDVVRGMLAPAARGSETQCSASAARSCARAFRRVFACAASHAALAPSGAGFHAQGPGTCTVELIGAI